jgi:hypothetical protein
MAYSRGSFPLFAICLIVIAAYIVYLITAKNIFINRFNKPLMRLQGR